MSLPPPAPRAFPFEARPLLDPVDRQDVRRFHEELKRRFPTSGANVVVIVVLGVIFVPVVLVVLGIFATVIGSFVRDGRGLIALPFLLVILAGLSVAVWAIVRHVLGGRRERRYRLDRFARANGLAYIPKLDAPPLPGLIFDDGHSRVATDLLRGEQPRFVEFANYQYTTGSGKNQQTHRWGYVAIHTGTPLPHIVLDAVGNNSVFGSNLPARFAKAQRLSLEGDFDRYFTLYCPEGYERDALYLFTPDVMARFVDSAAQLDVEIIDEWLFLYTGRPVSTTDPATWAWLFSAVSALTDKLAQWQRWRDERLVPTAAALPFHTASAATPPPAGDWLGPRGVAQPGRRLKGGIPWIAIVVILLALGVFAGPPLLGALGLLFAR
ncbi:hypothetical protein [Microbacterium rhizophilus]|uniref:hypothetical protein n=1 Tax=Microbacterium rhizophilus TaxID=3138934 RepID=UPI0031ED7A94